MRCDPAKVRALPGLLAFLAAAVSGGVAAKGESLPVFQSTVASREETVFTDEAFPVTPVRLGGISESLWDIHVGAAVLTRGTLAGSPVMEEFFPAPGVTLLSASDYRFGFAAGPDISGVRKLSDSRFFQSVDFRYFDVQAISAGAQVDTDGKTWSFPDQTGSISVIDTVDARYTSRLYSFEANLRRNIGDSGVVFLNGFRWLQVSDTMGLVGSSPSTSISWNWNTNNNLYGYQVGAFVPLIPTQSRWSLSASPKIGIYGNQCLSQWNDGSPAGTIQNRNSIFRNQVAFAGDLSVRLGYRISRRCSFQAGYQLLWLNGVGVAGDQVPVLSSPAIFTGLNSSGSAFFHGALVGINFLW